MYIYVYYVLMYIYVYIYFSSCGSFSFLWGPYEHMRLVLSTAHLPFSAFYCLSVLATLYFALLVSDSHHSVRLVSCCF